MRSYRGGRSEPTGLLRLRKQVIEEKEGPLGLKRGKGKGNTPVEEEGEAKGMGVLLTLLLRGKALS